MTGSAPAEPAASVVGPYAGQRIALLTQHGKEGVIASVLDAALGCRVERVSGFDTDTLGTFTRDIPRPGTQREAARRKARIGMELSSLPLGLASEGAFGPDPMTGMFAWNVELLVFIDDERGIEVTGVARGKTNFPHLLTTDWAAAKAFAQQADFPAHHLVMRPEREDDPRMHKGIAAWAELEAAFISALAESANGQIFVETDVRAHANPTRMDNIRLATEDLAKKRSSLCPGCGTPGFWIVERVAGLPCADCGAPTRETREQTDRQYAEPGRCDACNP
ncbi:DUF6671 family protein [Thiobacillus denitrificans]|uniref:DUF6671 domain-containing protein n=1 Tax=Thiobacillus denitrificans TaxID=36861 RepID=A0A106BQ96_THIDE|nr:DUF6671 family protein [Thiobacillus denitrificans]KVW96656.1 hypothetical protein ABW22_06800 [Thiobacillus denitrificans]